MRFAKIFWGAVYTIIVVGWMIFLPYAYQSPEALAMSITMVAVAIFVFAFKKSISAREDSGDGF